MKSRLSRITHIAHFALCLALLVTATQSAHAEELVGSIPGQFQRPTGRRRLYHSH